MFHLTIEVGLDAVTVCLGGDVDAAAEAQLHDVGDQVADHLGGRAVVIDPGRVSFIDCHGARALLDVYLDLVDRGFEVSIAEPSDPVRHFFVMTGPELWRPPPTSRL